MGRSGIPGVGGVEAPLRKAISGDANTIAVWNSREEDDYWRAAVILVLVLADVVVGCSFLLLVVAVCRQESCNQSAKAWNRSDLACSPAE